MADNKGKVGQVSGRRAEKALYADTPNVYLIDAAVMRRLVRLFDFCYRQGVFDAESADDAGLCREYCRKTRQPGVFGFVSDGWYMDVEEWQLRLASIARRDAMFGLMNDYFTRMGRFGMNYLSCFLPVAQCFYRRGLEDYCSNPIANDIEIFKGKKYNLWGKKRLRKAGTGEYVEMIQLYCFELMRRDIAVREEYTRYAIESPKQITKEMRLHRRGTLSENQYKSFIRAVGMALLGNKGYHY